MCQQCCNSSEWVVSNLKERTQYPELWMYPIHYKMDRGSIIWWIGGSIIWWTGYIIWWTGYIIWWIPFFDKFAISLVFNSPRIKEFEFNGCCEIVFSISHSIAELFMLFSFGWLGVHHMMDRGGHHMMDGVHYIMDRVHHMMDGVHHMMGF